MVRAALANTDGQDHTDTEEVLGREMGRLIGIRPIRPIGRIRRAAYYSTVKVAQFIR